MSYYNLSHSTLQSLRILGKLQHPDDLTYDIETSPLFHMTFSIELGQIFVIWHFNLQLKKDLCFKKFSAPSEPEVTQQFFTWIIMILVPETNVVLIAIIRYQYLIFNVEQVSISYPSLSLHLAAVLKYFLWFNW